MEIENLPEIFEIERFYLEQIVTALSRRQTDPKFDAVLYFLQVRA
ncbi:MAG: hypothetical protein ABJF23_26685 [Bryobacteraceae bacterium]